MSIFLLLDVFATAPGAAPAGPAGLDLEHAVALAQARDERIRKTEEARHAAVARVQRARAFFFPEVTFTGSYTRRGSESRFQKTDALSATVALRASVFDARSFPLYRQAKLEREAAELDALEERRLVGFEAADAYLATLGAGQVVKAAERRVTFAEQSLADARARAASDLASSNDVTRAELERKSAERELTRARGQAETATLMLGHLIGADVAGPLAEPESLLEAARAGRGDSGSTEALVTAARARRLDVLALRRRADALSAFAEEPSRRSLPTLDALGQTRATNETGFQGRTLDWFVGLTLTWGLWDGGERAAETRERRAAARAADLTVSADERQIRLDVETAVLALGRARRLVEQAGAAAAFARKNVEETATLYRQGLARVLEVADANVRLFEAEVALSQEGYGLALAHLDLLGALGLDALGREVVP